MRSLKRIFILEAKNLILSNNLFDMSSYSTTCVAPRAIAIEESSPITIIIVDDHALIRENWSYIFKRDERFAVIGEAVSGEEAIQQAKRLKPHVVLMDINLPGMNGMEATRLLQQEVPDIIVIGVSMHCHPEFAKGMLQSGASGYITKTSSREELIQAILEAKAGYQYLCDEVKNYKAI